MESRGNGREEKITCKKNRAQRDGGSLTVRGRSRGRKGDGRSMCNKKKYGSIATDKRG